MTEEQPTFTEFKTEVFKDPKFKIAYDNLRPDFDLAAQFIIARRTANLSQNDVAEKLHTKQPAIARLENGGYTKTSIDKLQAYADVLGCKLYIQLIPKQQQI
jgi:predicted XRE-type DNA-binding protein